MKHRYKLLHFVCALLLVAITSLCGGCASIVHSGNRNINLASVPSGAHVTVSKKEANEVIHSGTTPMLVSLDPKRGYFKGQAYVVKFELNGYRTSYVEIRPEMSGWYIGNILFGGLIGMLAVDPVTGSMWNLTPDKVETPLSPEQAAIIKDHSGFVVVLASQLTDKERSSMVRVN